MAVTSTGEATADPSGTTVLRDLLCCLKPTAQVANGCSPAQPDCPGGGTVPGQGGLRCILQNSSPGR